MKNFKKITALAVAVLMCLSFCVFAFAAKYGDVDNSGEVDPADARLALRIAVSLDEKPADITYIDVDADGDVTANDARLILRYSVALDDSFPAESGEEPTDPTDPTEPAEPVDFEPYGDLAVLRSGKMHIKSTAYEYGSVGEPIEFAIDGSDFYMSAEAEGLNLGILVKGKDLYAICYNNNTYHKISALEKVTLKAAGLDIDELLGQVTVLTEKLANAGEFIKVEENYTDADGNVYDAIYYSSEDGSSVLRYLMTGDKLIRSEVLDLEGNRVNYVVYELIDSDTSTVITDPKNYPVKLTNVSSGLTFMMNIAEFMGVEL